MKIAELMRMSTAKRWGIVNTSREQNLAEHSFNVMVIAARIGSDCGWNGMLHPNQHLQLITWALMHDSIEVFTGDTPTPYKERLRATGADLAAIDREYDRAYYEISNIVRGSVVGAIVKLADTIEAVHFLQDHGVGHHAREEVLPLLRDQLEMAVDQYSAEYPDLSIRDAVRGIAKELGV